MANSWRLQAGVAIGLGLLASTAACERNESPPASIGQPAQQLATMPPTSFVTVTTTPTTIPVEYIDDCVEFVQFAAYIGVADMATMWEAASHDAARLRENCISLGRGDPNALREISLRRDELEAYFGVTTTAGTAAETNTTVTVTDNAAGTADTTTVAAAP
jgi:hypothetical protein